MMQNVAYIPGRLESLLLLVLRLVTGGLFLFSAWNKLFPENVLNAGPLPGPHYFAQSLEAFNLLPREWIPVATFAIPWMEVVVGVCLILGWWTRAAARLGLLLLVMFTGAVAIVLAQQGTGVKCGCFGKFKLYCEGGVSYCKIGENMVLMGLFLIPGWRGGGRYAANVEMLER